MFSIKMDLCMQFCSSYDLKKGCLLKIGIFTKISVDEIICKSLLIALPYIILMYIDSISFIVYMK